MPISPLVPAALFAQAASVGMVFALLAELKDEHGLSTTAIGLISGIGLFAGVVGQIGLAPLADRGWGRELLVAGQIVGAIGAFGFAFGTEVWHFVAFRAISGIALGAYEPAAQALVVTRDQSRAGELLGRLMGIKTAGFLVGPGLGAVAADLGTTDTPFLIIGAALLAIGVPLARIAPTKPAPPPDGAPTTVRQLLTRRPAIAATLLSAALLLPIGLYDAIWAILMADRGASTLFTGLTLSLYGLPFMALAPLGGRLVDRHGPTRLMPAALIIVIATTVLYGMARLPGLLASLALLEASGNALGMPAAQAAMARATAPHERALGFGVAAAAGQITAGVVAFIVAPLYAAHGQFTTFASTAVAIALVGAAGHLLLVGSGKEPHPTAGPQCDSSRSGEPRPGNPA